MPESTYDNNEKTYLNVEFFRGFSDADASIYPYARIKKTKTGVFFLFPLHGFMKLNKRSIMKIIV